jgi:3-oxoacyl-[acyl-carrier protein] reductase
MSTLTNKVALVTGGSRSIGAAIVKKLAQQGAAVAFTYVSSADKANALAAEIVSAGGKATAIKADSANATEIKAAVDKTVELYGKLDILVNNAGVAVWSSFDTIDEQAEELDRQAAINITGVVAGVRAAVKHLQEGGRIITIGSVVGDRVGFAGASDYSGTKAAVAGYSRGWAWDLGAKGITVNTVQPGPIDTDMNPDNTDMATGMKSKLALGRYGKAEEIAAVVAFLAGPEASFITGTSINVDGGFSA